MNPTAKANLLYQVQMIPPNGWANAQAQQVYEETALELASAKEWTPSKIIEQLTRLYTAAVQSGTP